VNYHDEIYMLSFKFSGFYEVYEVLLHKQWNWTCPGSWDPNILFSEWLGERHV